MQPKSKDQPGKRPPQFRALRRLLSRARAGTLGAAGFASLARSVGASSSDVTIDYRRCHVAFVSNASSVDVIAVYYSDHEGQRQAAYRIDPTTTDPRRDDSLVIEYDANKDRTQIQLAEHQGALVCVIAERSSARTTRTNPTDVCVPAGFNTAPVASFMVSNETPRVGDEVTVTSTATDNDDPERLYYEWDLNGDSTYETAGATVTTTYADPGPVTIRHRVTDDCGASDIDTKTITIKPPNRPPTASFNVETADTDPTTDAVTVTVDETVTFLSTATDPNLPDDTLSYEWDLDGDGTYEISGEVVTTTYDIASTVTVTHRVTDSGGLSDTATATITVVPATDIPEAPKAPELDQTVVTSFADRVSYLHSGDSAVQTGVDVSAFQDYRVAVVRGSVRKRGGDVLSGVTVSAHDHPEHGQTLSRADGRYDLVINGGGWMTIDFTREGYLPAQRSVYVPWEDYVFVPDVAMVPVEEAPTTVEMGASIPQTVVASTSSDGDGERRAVLFFPSGVAAVADGDDGTVVPESLSVRAIEYTIGEDGEDAMPGQLPPTSAYTYAAEYMAEFDSSSGTIDSTTRPLMTLDGAGEVRFDQPVVNYIENFLDFSVGGGVPAGYFDPEERAWVASENGRVVEILGVVDAKATLDIDGSGTPADATALKALGVTDEERAELAALYPVGQQLWRTPIPHFTPWDCNWPSAPVDGAKFPGQPDPRSPGTAPDSEDPCEQVISG